MRPLWDPADVVPRRMLDLARDTLRLCLARGLALTERVAELEREVNGRIVELEAEVEMLRRLLRGR